MAMIKAAKANNLSTNGRCLMDVLKDASPEKFLIEGTFILASFRLLFFQYKKIITGNSNSSQKKNGIAKLVLLK